MCTGDEGEGLVGTDWGGVCVRSAVLVGGPGGGSGCHGAGGAFSPAVLRTASTTTE